MGEVSHVRLSKMRIGEALRELNDALSDAHRIDSRTEVRSQGRADFELAEVVMMNPVSLRLGGGE